MKGMLGSIQRTIVRGVLLLVPITVFAMLVGKALGALRKVIEPIAGPMAALGGVPMPVLLSIVALVLLCYVAGLASRTRWAKGLSRWLDNTVLVHIPGYTYMKGMGENLVGAEGGHAYQPVLARIEDSWQLGFIVETIEPGQYAVYVPGAPSPWSGAVYFMAEDRIRRLDMRIGEVQGILKRLGIGSSGLLRGKLEYTPGA